MAAIQNFKNFLRHGKQARQNAEPTTNVSNVHAQSQHQRYNQAPDPVHHGITEPVMDHKPLQHNNNNLGPADYSVGAGAGDNRNIAAQAGDAAARAVDEKRKREAKAAAIDPQLLERIVAEEREAKGKLPRYPGLERWTLLEKMGDGAFSNVYRARDTTGQWDEVAIKVVRKFEMNSQQVSQPFPTLFQLPLRTLTCNCPSLMSSFRSTHVASDPFGVFWTLPTRGRCRATSICIRTSRRQKQPRCALSIPAPLPFSQKSCRCSTYHTSL